MPICNVKEIKINSNKRHSERKKSVLKKNQCSRRNEYEIHSPVTDPRASWEIKK